jgi:DNA-binding response OmpR family regulator
MDDRGILSVRNPSTRYMTVRVYRRGTIVSPDNSRPRVLVVEDDADLATLYASILRPTYEVRTAQTGAAALDSLNFDPDVVLLDRDLSDTSGEALLDTLQAERVDGRIAMVTATDPDFDIIELGIDDYLTKPVVHDALHETVSRLLTLEALDDTKCELSSKRIKRNLLEVEKHRATLADHEGFQQLEREIQRLEREVSRLESELHGSKTPVRSVA